MCVPSSERTPEGRIRHRHCRLCGYLFDTVMHLPLECPHCDAFDNFRCIKTRNIFGGILRTYRCRECMKYVPTYEAFPVPEESRRKPDLRNYD